MASRFNVIDLSQLGTMHVLETVSSESLIAARMAKLVEIWAAHDPPAAAQYDVGALEFDPLKIQAENESFFDMLLRDRINQAARDTTLAFAFGTDLDAIASNYPVGPRQVGESDDRYRRRTQISINATSPHGSAGSYMYWALTADGNLKDATETGVEGTGEVVLTVMADSLTKIKVKAGNVFSTHYVTEPRPTLARLLAIRAFIMTEYRKGATDILTVTSPIVKDTKYRARVWFFPPPDRDTLMLNIRIALEALVEKQRWLGADHTRMAIDAALAQEGVHRSIIDEPAADILVSPRGLVRVTDIELTYMGRDE